MASVNGNWFHSRSSSHCSELLTVRDLVLESQKPTYGGFQWSGSRHNNQKMNQFAGVVNIQPSTMQTKIRAMIRYGFIMDSNVCPLNWTGMGRLWNELYTIGNLAAAKQIYELILSFSLAIYAFSNSINNYTVNPANGEMPLKFLLNRLNGNNAISLQEFTTIVDGTTTRVGGNTSYWKTDLLNSGLFQESDEHLVLTGKYSNLVHDLRNFTPSNSLDDEDWKKIRENPLIEISPFKDTVKKIFEEMTQRQTMEEQISDEIYTDPIVDVISEEEEELIPELDILCDNQRFSNNIRRVRNATWSLRVKKKYNYICAVPRCDVTGKIFVESAHIKPNSSAAEGMPHRAHMLNGICLCRHCHVAFDRGYFSLSDDHRIIISKHFQNIQDQNLKTVIQSSTNEVIKSRSDDKMPLQEFICYHRENKFKG